MRIRAAVRALAEERGLDLLRFGGVAERLKAPVLKTGRGFALSRVRIPPPPFTEDSQTGCVRDTPTRALTDTCLRIGRGGYAAAARSRWSRIISTSFLRLIGFEA